MKRKINKIIILQLIILIIIPVLFWKVFDLRYINTVKEFEYLTSLSPEEIINDQAKYGTRWKYFIAAKSLDESYLNKNNSENQENTHDLKAQYYTELILTQLKQNNNDSLELSNIDKQYTEAFTFYLETLNKYKYYDKRAYTFPIAVNCYYEDTFGADREGGKRVHQGTDLFNQKGTRIVSVCNGIVEKLGWNRLGGERVGIRGEDHNYYYYAHLDQINQDLYIGKVVSAGDFLGTMGNTGDALTTPDHLHFGIELTNHDWINPYPFLKVWEYYTFRR